MSDERWFVMNPHICPGAVRYLKQHRHGARLLHDFGMGGHLIYELWPSYRVFIDGRNDFYHREGLFRAYLEILDGGRRAKEQLEAHPCDTAIVLKASPLRAVLADLGGWREVYADDAGVVLIRDDSHHSP